MSHKKSEGKIKIKHSKNTKIKPNKLLPLNIDKYINANAMTDKNFFCNDSHHQKFEQYNDVYCFIWRKG